jgi:hypothetical protein
MLPSKRELEPHSRVKRNAPVKNSGSMFASASQSGVMRKKHEISRVLNASVDEYVSQLLPPLQGTIFKDLGAEGIRRASTAIRVSDR